MMILLLAIIASLPQTQSVDLLELNHFHDSKGCHVFTQLIAWEIDASTRRHRVRGWKMVNEEHHLPIRNYVSGMVEARWSDTLKVHSRLFRESWTQKDPEREDVKVHPERISLERNK